jgi:hypothetical protein
VVHPAGSFEDSPRAPANVRQNVTPIPQSAMATGSVASAGRTRHAVPEHGRRATLRLQRGPGADLHCTNLVNDPQAPKPAPRAPATINTADLIGPATHSLIASGFNDFVNAIRKGTTSVTV